MDGNASLGHVAGLRDALAQGPWASRSDMVTAADLEAAAPGSRKLTEVMWDFHRRAAAWAVTEARHARPAQAVVFTAAGRAPKHDPPRSRSLHADAARAAPLARFCYLDAGPQVTLLNRANLALPEPARVTAAEADEEDPEGVLEAAARTGIPVDGPLSVHVMIAPQRWYTELATGILGLYRKLLEPGSSVCLTLADVAPGAAGDKFLQLLSAYTGTTHRHTAADVAAWAGDAGLELHPRGVTDARTWARADLARAGAGGGRPVVLVMGAVAIVPGRRRGPGPG